MINIVLTGLNGYGEHFIPELLEGNDEYRLVAVVSRNPKKSKHYEGLVHKGVRLYTTLEEALAENVIHLAIISTPMFIHYKEVMLALKAGAHVYCEKPLAPTIDECLEIREAAKKADRLVAVGFQWSFSKGILELKRDILSGRYGKIKQMKTLVNWNRPKSYFEESSWKGKMVMPDGSYVLESVMSNGAVHFLHNLFFLCGDTLETSAYPVSLEGEGYHAYPVEGYDTTAIRMKTERGQELLYYATILAKESKPAQFELQLEHALIRYPEGEDMQIKVSSDQGEVVYYECPEKDRFSHFKRVIKAIEEHKGVPCDVETVLPEVIAVNAAAQSIRPMKFPPKMVSEDKTNIYAHHIDEILEKCYQSAVLPSEAGYSFAKSYQAPALTGYRHFAGLCCLENEYS